jgi:hypothetical protein
MSDDLERLRDQARTDMKLFRRAEQALAEIDRSQGLTDEQADVLAALRIRIEGKERASLEDLLSAAGDMSGKRDLNDVLSEEPTKETSDWPTVEERSRDWPGL